MGSRQLAPGFLAGKADSSDLLLELLRRNLRVGQGGLKIGQRLRDRPVSPADPERSTARPTTTGSTAAGTMGT